MPRPRAYEPLPVPFRFVDIPHGSPIRDTAVFVVHGIGNQGFPETAVTLRAGFEDAIGDILGRHSASPVPPPFAWEGYWADYADFERTFPREWGECTDRERVFFKGLWERRSGGSLRTAGWLLLQYGRLACPWTHQGVGGARKVTLMAAAPLTAFLTASMLLRHRSILRDVLSDIRVYCSPRGSVEEAIVQRIDRRVGEEFLRLLGLDWDFRDLPSDRWVAISGTRHRFRYVTWVAHSLGTVISYNVLADLLHRATEIRNDLDARDRKRGPGVDPPPEDGALRANVERVERGIRRFVTMGSPLELVLSLFPAALREWHHGDPRKRPDESGDGRRWWVNFHHVWDPVSSPLVSRRFLGGVSNHHGRVWRIPGLAHVSYWRDRAILKYVVSRAYGPGICRWESPQFAGETLCAFLGILTRWILLPLVVLLMTWFLWWAVFEGGWSRILQAAKVPLGME